MSHVLSTDHGDGSADMTVCDSVDHRFSVRSVNGAAVVSYEESHYSGRFRTGQPSEDIWQAVMQSDEMTQFLEREGCQTVRREQNS